MGFNRSDIKISFNNEGTKFYVNEKKGTVVCSVEACLLVPTDWDGCVYVPGNTFIEKGIANAMAIRHEVYNNQLKEIKELEKGGRIFVIRPKYKLDIGKTEKDPEKLEKVYQEGRRLALKILPTLNDYLK